MTPSLERKILRRRLAGRTGVEIACEVMIELRAVERVLAARDTVALAAEITAEGGQPVLDARDDVEADALAAVAEAWAGPAALAQIPEVDSQAPASSSAPIAKAGKGMARTEASTVTVGRDRQPPSTVVQFPAPVLRHDGVPAAEMFAGTRLERAFGPGPGVGLGDLMPGQCCWPLWPHGARPDFRCCGAPAAEGARYCAEHARRSRGAAAGAIDGLGKWASSA